MKLILPVLVGLFGVFFLSGCTKCSSETGLDVSVETPGSKSMVWEEVLLGTNMDTFKTDVAKLANLAEDEKALFIKCREMITFEVINPKDGAIEERSKGNHNFESCILSQAGRQKSWKLISIRGGFVDGILASLTFSFPQESFESTVAEISKRYGAGKNQVLEENDILGEVKKNAQIWNVKGIIWAVLKGPKETRLTIQDPKKTLILAEPKKAIKKGAPVKLDDLGLGGGLDLENEKEPELPDIDTEGLGDQRKAVDKPLIRDH